MTVTHDSKRASTSGAGQPNVNETTAGGSASSSASFASQSSSSAFGAPISSPSACRRSTYGPYVSGSATGPGTNRFTPNGRSVSSRVRAIRRPSSSAVR